MVSVDGKGGARLRQVRIEETNASEPLMKCRKVSQRCQNRELTSSPGGGWGELADGPIGIRHGGGGDVIQALVRNGGTLRPGAKGKDRGGRLGAGRRTEAGHRGGRGGSGGMDTAAAVGILHRVAGRSAPAGCPSYQDNVNCDNAIDARDVLAVLRYLAGTAPLPVPTGCTPIGSPLLV